mmetsp:Transcript_55903/g.144227  ORF Transcript_55903/g.144227 Transcript_55903/m.144227 type:complete len:217 (+) Transcript_55903:127-777(+)
MARAQCGRSEFECLRGSCIGFVAAQRRGQAYLPRVFCGLGRAECRLRDLVGPRRQGPDKGGPQLHGRAVRRSGIWRRACTLVGGGRHRMAGGWERTTGEQLPALCQQLGNLAGRRHGRCQELRHRRGASCADFEGQGVDSGTRRCAPILERLRVAGGAEGGEGSRSVQGAARRRHSGAGRGVLGLHGRAARGTARRAVHVQRTLGMRSRNTCVGRC